MMVTSSVPDVSVVVVAICSLGQLQRAVRAIDDQKIDGVFDIIVSADPRLGNLDEVRSLFPHVAFHSHPECKTPIELTVVGLRNATGARVALTEDSCIAAPDWLSSITRVSPEGRGAIGGAVEAASGISSAMWAFCYVDFFRYMRPLAEGQSPTLSVCNVSYRRADLIDHEDAWANGFHETEIHTLLERTIGPLWLAPSAEVRVSRDVSFRDAVYERYAFGRLFGATRITQSPLKRRLWYAAVSPALPFLLLGRMTSKARKDSALSRRFTAAFPAILAMVLAWSWGEWLGYVTARRPRRITTAPEKQSSR